MNTYIYTLDGREVCRSNSKVKFARAYSNVVETVSEIKVAKQVATKSKTEPGTKKTPENSSKE